MFLKFVGGFKVIVWLLELSFLILRVNVGLGYLGWKIEFIICKIKINKFKSFLWNKCNI